MSTYTARRAPRKRRDLTPIFLLVISVVALPVLGLVAWKVLKQKPAATVVQQQPTQPAQKQPATPAARPQTQRSSMDGVGEVSTETRPIPRAGRTSFQDVYDSDEQRFGNNGQFRNGSGMHRGSSGGYSGGGDASRAIEKAAASVNQALSLPKKVLVVWLFDQSASASSLRSDVVGQLSNFYGKLKPPAGSADDQPVLSMVGHFGEKVTFATEEPVATAADVEAAASKGGEDPGHVENTFAAIAAAAEKALDYRKKKGRYVTIIVVTDEAGDDRARVDEVLAKLTPYGIPVQVIGPSAMFAEAEGPNRMAEGNPPPGEIWVTQGPDTHDPDWIKLESTRGAGDVSGIDTGMGTYQLSRLCKETDGSYLVTSYSGEDFRLKGFEPQYISEKEYAEQLQSNKAKRALVEAAKLPRAAIQTHMNSTFQSTDDVARNKALESAQKPVAKVMPGIDAIYNALKAGEADLPKLSGSNDKRWRAAFLVALGRAGAAKVRHQGYIEMTAQMKSGRKFADEKHDTWVLESVDEPMGISALDKMAQKSREYLTEVVKSYPNTPWAQAAEAELQTPLSYKWIER
jgi:hypothetical protein